MFPIVHKRVFKNVLKLIYTTFNKRLNKDYEDEQHHLSLLTRNDLEAKDQEFTFYKDKEFTSVDISMQPGIIKKDEN